MPIIYKINVLEALKKAGYSTYRLRQLKLFGERNIQKIRDGEILNGDNLCTICKLLDCQPGDILEYVPDNFEIIQKPDLEEIHTIAAFEGDTVITRTKKGAVDEAIRKIKEKQE